MAGTFTIGETKTRPGIYHRYENAGGVSIAGAINGIGARRISGQLGAAEPGNRNGAQHQGQSDFWLRSNGGSDYQNV